MEYLSTKRQLPYNKDRSSFWSNENLLYKQAVEKLRSITLFYNGADINIDQFDICYFWKEWKDLSKEWSNHLISLGSLTDNLIAFLKEKINLTREISH